MTNRRHFLLAASALLASACQSPGVRSPADASTNVSALPSSIDPAPLKVSTELSQMPTIPREFRGVWVATMANIDWPSKPGLPSAQQQTEAIAILDRVQRTRMNAVVLQVRPATDAIYPSEHEPWSEFLTGTQGQAPSPFYDPLKFWIDEAHRRGLELHVWLNPYRARHSSTKSAAAASHVSKRLADAVRTYGDMQWLDPGHPAGLKHSMAVVADITRRYDIDGIHIDDYFYPYPIKPAKAKADPLGTPNNADNWIDFPDEPSWQAYLADGGKLERNDWRRDNVNRFVEQMYTTVRKLKPWVKVGVSPFGLGRPDRRPPGISGFSQYDLLYADVELWLEKAWLDYLVPQLYWPIRQPAQAFDVLHEYWLKQNPQGRHVWPGLFTSKVGAADKSWAGEEILEQISLSRQRNPDGGQVHFSMVALSQDRQSIATQLANGPYAQAALPPACPWLDVAVPPASTLRRDGNAIQVDLPPSADILTLAIWHRYGEQWIFSWQSAHNRRVPLIADGQSETAAQVSVALLNRAGVEGPRVSLLITA